MSVRPITETAGAVATLVLASVVAGGPASAEEPEASRVNLVGCEFFEGGETTVEAGPVEVFVNWGAGPRGALVHWLNSQTTTFTVQYEREEPITQDVSDDWLAPIRLVDDKSWVSSLVLPLGELTAGETVLVSLVTTWSTPTIDFFFGTDPVVIFGDTLPASCLITATG